MKKFLVLCLIISMFMSLTGCCCVLPNDNLSENTSSYVEIIEPEDNTIIFKEGAVSNKANIEFIDQSGNVVITASDIANVTAQQTEFDGYSLLLELTQEGSKKFATATIQNIGKTISIYIDGEKIIAPTVENAITDGKVLVSNFESKEKLLSLYESLTNPYIPKPTALPIEEVTSFYFSSGAGGWGTELKLNPDGSFTGCYHDSDMGDMGDGYPNGTVYICNFSGKFENIKKIDEYSYQMTLTNLTIEETPDEWIEEGIKYIASGPYGIEGGTNFIFYMPNTPISSLSEEFLSWWPGRYDLSEPKDTLTGYGILNVETQEGFF